MARRRACPLAAAAPEALLLEHALRLLAAGRAAAGGAGPLPTGGGWGGIRKAGRKMLGAVQPRQRITRLPDGTHDAGNLAPLAPVPLEALDERHVLQGGPSPCGDARGWGGRQVCRSTSNRGHARRESGPAARGSPVFTRPDSVLSESSIAGRAAASASGRGRGVTWCEEIRSQFPRLPAEPPRESATEPSVELRATAALG